MKHITQLFLLLLGGIFLQACHPVDEFEPVTTNPISRIPTLDSLTVTETTPATPQKRTLDITWNLVVPNEETTGVTYRTASAIRDIVRDGDYLWVATNAGLLHWHIETGDVTQYSAPQTPLPDNYVMSLILRDGLLYMSTKTAVAIFDRQEQWTIMTNEEIGAETAFGRPLAFVDDTLWLGSSNGVFFLPPNGVWQAVDLAVFPYPKINAIEQTDEGIYFETHNGEWGSGIELVGILHTNDNEWQVLPELQPLVQIGPDGRWWQTATIELEDNSRQYHLLVSTDQGETWRDIYQSPDGLSIKSFDQEGNIYLSSLRSAILMIDTDEQFYIYDYRDVGPELNFINHIAAEENGRIWFATDGRGLTMFDGINWSNWQPETQEDMRDDAIRGLAVGDGKVYAGAAGSAASGGLMILDIENDSWQNFWPAKSGACPENKGGEPESGREWERKDRQACETTSLLELTGGGATRIAIDPQNGTAYVANDFGTLHIINGTEWKNIPIPAELPDTTGEFIVITMSGLGSQDAIVSTRGVLYLTSASAVFTFDGQDWQSIASSEQLGGPPNQIAFDKDGELWVSTEVGVAHIDSSGQIISYNETNAPFEEASRTRAVTVDAENNIWLVDRTMLYRFDGQAWQTYPPELFGHYAWGDALEVDHNGRLWIEANDGVMVFPTEVER